MKTIVGITSLRIKSFDAAKQLRSIGFKTDISLIWQQREPKPTGEILSFKVGYDDNLWDGGITGASLGALGGLLIGSGLIALPVLGTLAAIGPIAGLVTGTAAGGLAGALADWGISPQNGRDIEKALEAGKTVLLAQCPAQQVDSVVRFLETYGVEEIAIH